MLQESLGHIWELLLFLWRTEGWLVGLVYGLGWLAALEVILHGRTAQGTMAWVLALALAPFLSLPLYVLFGTRRMRGYVRMRFRSRRRAVKDAQKGVLARLWGRRPEGLDPWRLAMERLAGLPFTEDNQVRLLVNGEAAFEAMFASIASARELILVQFYIVRDDVIGRRLKSLLLEKAAQGVEVYFLCDGIGSLALPDLYLRELRKGGVRVATVSHWRYERLRLLVNFRNHRKLVIVDARAAFVGGHNVGDEYMDVQRWRDTHLLLEGPAALGAQLAFAEDWNWCTGGFPQFSWQPCPAAEPVPDQAAASVALVMPSGPVDELDSGVLCWQLLAGRARQRLWLATPYFVPDIAVVMALQAAALRGVDVRVIIPAKSDNLLVDLSRESFIAPCQKAGVTFWAFEGAFMHQKVGLIDDDLVSIGSANLDSRSLHLNFEVTAFVCDLQLARQVKLMLEDDLQHCRELRGLSRQSLGWRLAVRTARLLSPLQ